MAAWVLPEFVGPTCRIILRFSNRASGNWEAGDRRSDNDKRLSRSLVFWGASSRMNCRNRGRMCFSISSIQY